MSLFTFVGPPFLSYWISLPFPFFDQRVDFVEDFPSSASPESIPKLQLSGDFSETFWVSTKLKSIPKLRLLKDFGEAYLLSTSLEIPNLQFLEKLSEVHKLHAERI